MLFRSATHYNKNSNYNNISYLFTTKLTTTTKAVTTTTKVMGTPQTTTTIIIIREYVCPNQQIVNDPDECPEITTTTKITTTTRKPTTTGATTTIQPEESPSKVAEIYFEELMGWNLFGTDYQNMYSLLSDTAKDNLDFDKYSNDQELIKNAYIMQGVTFHFLQVQNEDINGETATVELKCKMMASGYPFTYNREIKLVKEDDSWKLDDAYNLNTCAAGHI